MAWTYLPYLIASEVFNFFMACSVSASTAREAEWGGFHSELQAGIFIEIDSSASAMIAFAYLVFWTRYMCCLYDWRRWVTQCNAIKDDNQ